MRTTSVECYYRAAGDKNSPAEDMFLSNLPIGVFGVADGASESYSSSFPQFHYGELTGGQMIVRKIARAVASGLHGISLCDILLLANHRVEEVHRTLAKRSAEEGHDVAGASFALCQLHSEGIDFLFGGDCFALVKSHEGEPIFLMQADEAAVLKEEEGIEKFAGCLELASGNIAYAWDLYQPLYRERRIFCSNRNIGKGGCAQLNGDPALEYCWMSYKIRQPEFVILGTDGLIPFSWTHPQRRVQLAKYLYGLYLQGGIKAIEQWRDGVEAFERKEPHIAGWPEATAVVLQLGE